MLQTVVHMLYKKYQMTLQGLTIEILIFLNEITFIVVLCIVPASKMADQKILQQTFIFDFRNCLDQV